MARRDPVSQLTRLGAALRTGKVIPRPRHHLCFHEAMISACCASRVGRQRIVCGVGDHEGLWCMPIGDGYYCDEHAGKPASAPRIQRRRPRFQASAARTAAARRRRARIAGEHPPQTRRADRGRTAVRNQRCAASVSSGPDGSACPAHDGGRLGAVNLADIVERQLGDAPA